MAQVNWIFSILRGGRHKVGLYHGDRSGHFLLHCNRSVVQVDFSVKQDKTYSFFIEEELVEIHLRREPNGFFSYEFVLNETADTPRNRIRKVEKKQNLRFIDTPCWAWPYSRWRSLLLAVFRIDGVLAKVSIASQAEIPPELASEGRTSFASFVLFDEGASRKARYSFWTRDSVLIAGLLSLPEDGVVLLPTGFPLVDNDAFSVLYLPKNPKIHRIDFNLPERNTIIRYVQRALAAELSAHPDKNPKQAMCFLESLVALKGWHPLADVIFQQENAENNRKNNIGSYQQLIHEPQMDSVIHQKCQAEQ